jgi:hypothetical protein
MMVMACDRAVGMLNDNCKETAMKQLLGRESTRTATPRIQNLSAGWKLACDPANQGKQLKWYLQPPEKEARPARIPGIIQDVFPDYHGVAWYWTTFRPTLKENPASVYALHFTEVDYFAEVWLNGVYLGSHEGAEFAFEMKVQKALKFDAENLLVVRVINPIEEPIDGFVLGDTVVHCGCAKTPNATRRSASRLRVSKARIRQGYG